MTTRTKGEKAKPKDVAKVRRAWLLADGVTLYDLGVAIGRQDSFVSIALRGQRTLTVEQLEKMAAVIRSKGGKV